jgi:hypothetical protein
MNIPWPLSLSTTAGEATASEMDCESWAIGKEEGPSLLLGKTALKLPAHEWV